MRRGGRGRLVPGLHLHGVEALEQRGAPLPRRLEAVHGNTPSMSPLEALTPALQRKLRWGDQRTSEAFNNRLLAELQGKTAWTPSSTDSGSNLTSEESALSMNAHTCSSSSSEFPSLVGTSPLASPPARASPAQCVASILRLYGLPLSFSFYQGTVGFVHEAALRRPFLLVSPHRLPQTGGALFSPKRGVVAFSTR